MNTITSRYPKKKKPTYCSGLLGFFVMGLFFLILLSGCANPVGVLRVSPQESYQDTFVNPMSEEELSNSSMAVLHRYNLQNTSTADLPKTIEILHNLIVRDDRRDLLFAIAEVSYLYGTKMRVSSNWESNRLAPDAFLQSAVYAYLFLLGEGREALPSAYDIRFREACDLYNRALWQAFPEKPDHSLIISPGVRKLPGGIRLQVAVQLKNTNWDPTQVVEIFPADAYKPFGFSVTNRTPGLGLPLIGKTVKTKESPAGGTLPITAFLRLPATTNGILADNTTVDLEFYSAFETADIEVNGLLVPLETDTTTPLAYVLNSTNLWNIGVTRFLAGGEVNKRMIFVQPYTPGRIPVVFVHGTASSPVWWAEMLNTLRADPLIRQKFQFWFYQYNTSNMILLSAADLRKTLVETIKEFDPRQQDAALQKMVVIGHSQGGLLTKLTAVDPGETLWMAVSDKEPDQMGLSQNNEKMLERMFFFKPLPFVKRVVFISTPHRGSYLTKNWVRDLVRKIITLPVNILTLNVNELNTLAAGMKLPASMRNAVPTSIDGMSADNPILQALAALPLEPGVVGNSIIAVKEGMDIESGNDGVVEYRSAYLPGVESEFVVRSPHSCQENPFTIEEVRRILLEHLSMSDTRMPEQVTAQHGPQRRTHFVSP